MKRFSSLIFVTVAVNCFSQVDFQHLSTIAADETQLKIADFDGCYFKGDKKMSHLVTKNFRAPEQGRPVIRGHAQISP